MLRAILFDFDGVIADTEPLHLQGFQRVLQARHITLSKADYYKRYLGYDDHACFRQIYRDRRKSLNSRLLEELVAEKTRHIKKWLRTRNVLLPGAKRVIKMLACRYPLAIVSGALRAEIQLILRQADLRSYFAVLIAAEDVKKGKPHPDGYQSARRLLNENLFSPEWPLRAQECLVIEDSQWGIQAAQRAKMPCLAVSTSYSKKDLQQADAVLKDIGEITTKSLHRLEKLVAS